MQPNQHGQANGSYQHLPAGPSNPTSGPAQSQTGLAFIKQKANGLLSSIRRPSGSSQPSAHTQPAYRPPQVYPQNPPHTHHHQPHVHPMYAPQQQLPYQQQPPYQQHGSQPYPQHGTQPLAPTPWPQSAPYTGPAPNAGWLGPPIPSPPAAQPGHSPWQAPSMARPPAAPYATPGALPQGYHQTPTQPYTQSPWPAQQPAFSPYPRQPGAYPAPPAQQPASSPSQGPPRKDIPIVHATVVVDDPAPQPASMPPGTSSGGAPAAQLSAPTTQAPAHPSAGGSQRAVAGGDGTPPALQAGGSFGASLLPPGVAEWAGRWYHSDAEGARELRLLPDAQFEMWVSSGGGGDGGGLGQGQQGWQLWLRGRWGLAEGDATCGVLRLLADDAVEGGDGGSGRTLRAQYRRQGLEDTIVLDGEGYIRVGSS